jgi:hypothetical protein
MPSTDIDGTPIIVLGKADAEIVYDLFLNMIDPWGPIVKFNKQELALRKKICDFLGVEERL